MNTFERFVLIDDNEADLSFADERSEFLDLAAADQCRGAGSVKIDDLGFQHVEIDRLGKSARLCEPLAGRVNGLACLRPPQRSKNGHEHHGPRGIAT